VMVAEPAEIAVTVPDVFTVATAVLDDVHVTALLVAFAGLTVAVKVSVPPTVRDVAFLFRLTPVTGTVGIVTVTLQIAVLAPSVVVTVMLAEPAETAVTLPLASTVETEVLEDVQVTALLVAFVGLTVAVKVSVPPTVREVAFLFRVTPVTATVGIVTVTLQMAVFNPSVVVTVIVAVPAETAVIRPDELTVATAVLEDVQVTALLVAFVGVTVAVKVSVAPTVSDVSVLFRVTPVTAPTALTVMVHIAVLAPSAVFTVIVVEPAATAETLP